MYHFIVDLCNCVAFTFPWARKAVRDLLLKTEVERRMLLRAIMGDYMKLLFV